MDSSKDKSLSSYNKNTVGCDTDCNGRVDKAQQFIVVNIIVIGSSLTIYFSNTFIYVFIVFFFFVFVKALHRVKSTKAYTNSEYSDQLYSYLFSLFLFCSR